MDTGQEDRMNKRDFNMTYGLVLAYVHIPRTIDEIVSHVQALVPKMFQSEIVSVTHCVIGDRAACYTKDDKVEAV